VRLPGVGFALVAWFALSIAGALVVQPEDADALALAGLFTPSAICHAEGKAPAPGPLPGHHHHRNCPLCPICVAHAQTALLLPKPAPVPSGPTVAATPAAAWRPPPLGPPTEWPRTAQPRAPPSPT
jgi:hypothetical protein